MAPPAVRCCGRQTLTFDHGGLVLSRRGHGNTSAVAVAKCRTAWHASRAATL